MFSCRSTGNTKFHSLVFVGSDVLWYLQQISLWMYTNLLRLNFLLLVPKGNFLKQTTLSSILLTLHATLVSFFMRILRSPITSHHFLSPAILVSVSARGDSVQILDREIRKMWLSGGERISTIVLAIFTQCQRVTNGQTELSCQYRALHYGDCRRAIITVLAGLLLGLLQ